MANKFEKIWATGEILTAEGVNSIQTAINDIYPDAITVDTLKNIPMQCSVVNAVISESADLTIQNAPIIGKEVNIVIKNTADTDIIVKLPTVTPYVCISGTTVSIKPNHIKTIRITTASENVVYIEPLGGVSDDIETVKLKDIELNLDNESDAYLTYNDIKKFALSEDVAIEITKIERVLAEALSYQQMLINSLTDRYNDILNKYNNLTDRYNDIIENGIQMN